MCEIACAQSRNSVSIFACVCDAVVCATCGVSVCMQGYMCAKEKRESSVRPWEYSASAEHRSPGSRVKAGLSVAQMHPLHSLQSNYTNTVSKPL